MMTRAMYLLLPLALAACGAPVAYLLHGVSAWWSTALLLTESVTGEAPDKPRTPMRGRSGSPS